MSESLHCVTLFRRLESEFRQMRGLAPKLLADALHSAETHAPRVLVRAIDTGALRGAFEPKQRPCAFWVTTKCPKIGEELAVSSPTPAYQAASARMNKLGKSTLKRDPYWDTKEGKAELSILCSPVEWGAKPDKRLSGTEWAQMWSFALVRIAARFPKYFAAYDSDLNMGSTNELWRVFEDDTEVMVDDGEEYHCLLRARATADANACFALAEIIEHSLQSCRDGYIDGPTAVKLLKSKFSKLKESAAKTRISRAAKAGMFRSVVVKRNRSIHRNSFLGWIEKLLEKEINADRRWANDTRMS